MKMKRHACAVIFIACLWVASALAGTSPVLESVTLSTNHLQNGGSITVTVIAVSESPVNWINRSLDGPNGNIYGGGGSWPPWTDLGNNRWQCQWIDEISSWAPSGEYVYRYISVENEAQLESGVWPDLSFSARNRIIESISTEGHSVSITFPTESGRTFLVQRSPSLNPPEWVTVETIVGTGTPTTATNEVGVTGGFFRIVMQE